jgi:aminoglycoside/choline kinase family phosphotransferase
MTEQLIAVREFAREYFNLDPDRVTQMAGAGSSRQYFRLLFIGKPVIGTWSEDIKENEAFFYLSEILYSAGINVPQVIAIDESRKIYLQTECATYDAYSILTGASYKDQQPWLRKIIDQLCRIQTFVDPLVDYSRCYPSSFFGKEDVMTDLTYFERYFLEAIGIRFDQNMLKQEFEKMAQRVENSHFMGFMYRDFQSRNIMVREDGELCFIDFQGARKGPCTYDVISLLYQAKLGLNAAQREELLEYYYSGILSACRIELSDLKADKDAVLPVRLLQVLGAYGRRGIQERKPHFVTSIGPAIDNLSEMPDSQDFTSNYPYLTSIIQEIIGSKESILCQIKD